MSVSPQKGNYALSSPTLEDELETASFIEKLQAENRVLQLQLLEKKISDSSPTKDDDPEEKKWKREDEGSPFDGAVDLDTLDAAQMQVEMLRRQLRRERLYRRYLQRKLTQEVQRIRVWIEHNRIRHREQLRRFHMKVMSSFHDPLTKEKNAVASSPLSVMVPVKSASFALAAPHSEENEPHHRFASGTPQKIDHNHAAASSAAGVASSPAAIGARMTESGKEEVLKEKERKKTRKIVDVTSKGVTSTEADDHSQYQESPDEERSCFFGSAENTTSHAGEAVVPPQNNENREHKAEKYSALPPSMEVSSPHLGVSNLSSSFPSVPAVDHANSFTEERTYYYKYSAPVHSKSEVETKSIIEEAVHRSETRRKQREALRSNPGVTGEDGHGSSSALKSRRASLTSVKFSDGGLSSVDMQVSSPIRLRGAAGSRGGDRQGLDGISSLTALSANLTATHSHSQYMNPNQIGEEIREDKKSRAWYVRHALHLAFFKAVRCEEGEEMSRTSLAFASRRGSVSAHSPALGTTSLRASCATSRKPSPLTSRPSSPIPFAAHSNPNGSASSNVERTSSSMITSALMGVNSASMQRAIQEVTHYYFYLNNNFPVLCTKPRATNVRVEDENDDPDLLQALDVVVKTGAPVDNVLEGGEKRKLPAGRAIPSIHGSTTGGGNLSLSSSAHQRSFSNVSQKNNSSGNNFTEGWREDDLRISFHAPVIFNQIREFLGLSVTTFRDAVENSVWRESLSPGKSGTSLIYFGDYVMKTLPESDYVMLTTQYLPAYAKYCEQFPNSLLTRFYSIVSVRWQKTGVTKCYVLMQNVFTTRQYIHRIYDVKGSTVGRSAIQPGKEPPRTAFGALLLKDNDIPDQLLRIGSAQQRVLLAQLRLDLQFLQRLSIVDYSMMIGVRSRVLSSHLTSSANTSHSLRSSTAGESRKGLVANLSPDGVSSLDSGLQLSDEIAVERVGEEEECDVTCLRSCDGGLQSLPIQLKDDTTTREEVYYIGLIDVLQEYNSSKKLENFAKGLYSDRTQISVIPPPEYAERLYKAIERISS